jgi:hypothetical protein
VEDGDASGGAAGVTALTVWGAVVAGAVTGPGGGVVAAAVLTALPAVAAGHVPRIRDAVVRRRAEPARLEAAEAVGRETLHRAGELLGSGPAGLLDPRRELVGFTSRRGPSG